MHLRLPKWPRAPFYKPTTDTRGRTSTTTTLDVEGTVCTEENPVVMIAAELEREFVDDGYFKITKRLQRKHKLLINKKKVYRLMSKHRLLNRRPTLSSTRKQWIRELVPNLALPLTHLESDIKYMPIHGCRRNAMMLTVLDVNSRFNIGWLMQWSIKKEDVVALFQDIRLNLPMVSKITVRSDNGSQFVAHLEREHFETHGIEHEFTRPAPSEQNVHTESYHGIIESACVGNTPSPISGMPTTCWHAGRDSTTTNGYSVASGAYLPLSFCPPVMYHCHKYSRQQSNHETFNQLTLKSSTTKQRGPSQHLRNTPFGKRHRPALFSGITRSQE